MTRPGARPRVALAVNPTSGRGRGRLAGTLAARRLREAGIDVVPLNAGSGPELAGLARDALGSGLDALIVVGGDGMVNLGVNLTAGTGVPLGVVAAGTGNDIARALRLPVADPAAATATIVAGLAATRAVGRGDGLSTPQGREGTAASWRTIDGVRCLTPSGRTLWFAGVLGAGFDALVNERANRWTWPRGPMRYNLAIARELPVFRPRRYRLELDGEVWSTEAMLVAVANGPSYGGGMRVCPDARLDDGLLDVLVVEPISRREFVRIFPRVYAGTHVRHPAVVIRRARRVRVAAEGIVGYADGERMASLPLDCEAVPEALTLLAPAASTAPANPTPGPRAGGRGRPEEGPLHVDGAAG